MSDQGKKPGAEGEWSSCQEPDQAVTVQNGVVTPREYEEVVTIHRDRRAMSHDENRFPGVEDAPRKEEEVVTIHRGRTPTEARARHEEERTQNACFYCEHAEPAYRDRLAPLHEAWTRFNRKFFGGRLCDPHMVLERTASRRLGDCKLYTGYGGEVQIIINESLAFCTNRDWVVNPWPPAEGTWLFLEDLILRLTVRQFVLEKVGDEEPGYLGFGPRFVAEANRIGAILGLDEVVERRRHKEDTKRVGKAWPHCVRPRDYYRGDVTEAALEMVAGVGARQKRPTAATEVLLDLVDHLERAGQREQWCELVMRHAAWVRGLETERFPRRQQVEKGKEDVDGSPLVLKEVEFRREWLEWKGGMVGRMVQNIVEHRSYADLPLLAVALEAAGCKDERILRHLRERMEHGPSCWVVRGLLGNEDG